MCDHHGKLSSASTGKFAALRFPFAFVLSELKESEFLVIGPSISISSSKSDILRSVGKYQWIVDCKREVDAPITLSTPCALHYVIIQASALR